MRSSVGHHLVIAAMVVIVLPDVCCSQGGELEFQGPGASQLPSTMFVPASYEEAPAPFAAWIFFDSSGNWNVRVSFDDDGDRVTSVDVIYGGLQWNRTEPLGISDASVSKDTIAFSGTVLTQLIPRLGDGISLIGALTRPPTPVDSNTWSAMKALYSGGG